MRLSWRAPDPAGTSPVSEYRLWWKTTGREYPSGPQATVGAPTASYTIDGLGPGEYLVKVAAASNAGEGNPQELHFGVLGVTILPGLDWTDISWPHTSAAARYIVQWTPAADAGWDDAAQANGAAGSTSYSVSGLTVGGTYRVRVRAIGAGNETLWSSEESVRLGTVTARKLEIARLSSRPDTVWVTWQAPTSSAGVDQFVIQWRRLGQRYATSRQYTLEPFGGRQEHYARLITIEDFDSNAHLWVRLKIVDSRNRVLSVVESGTLEHLLVLTGHKSAALVWPAVSGAVGYKVQWKLASAAGWDQAESATVADDVMTHTITGLSPDTSYSVRVQAEPNGNTPPPVSATVSTLASLAPQNLRVTALHESLDVGWDPPAGADGDLLGSYLLEWRAGDQSYSGDRRIELSGSTNRRTIGGLDNDVEYTVRVSAMDLNGDTEPSSDRPEWTGRPRDAATYIEEEIIADREDAYPWLAEAWREVPVRVRIVYDPSVGGIYTPGARLLTFSNTTYRGVGFVVHELAHHFSVEPAIYGGNHVGRLSVLSGWLWLKERQIRRGSNANVIEEYAGVMARLVLDGDDANQTADTHDTFTSISAGEIPQWFFDTYTSDGTLATVDHDRLWADLRELRCGLGHGCSFLGNSVVGHAQDLFGGYCSSEEADGVLWGDTVYLSPWIDGGCKNRRPQDVTATAGESAGEIEMSWSAPLWSTTPAIDAYVVQWKTGTDSYNTTNQAIVTDLSDLSHTISGLTSATRYSVRVAAVNQAAGTGVFTDGDGRARAGETTAAAG